MKMFTTSNSRGRKMSKKKIIKADHLLIHAKKRDVRNLIKTHLLKIAHSDKRKEGSNLFL